MVSARRDDEGGFTLIELVTALVLLSVAVFAIATVFSAGMRTGSVDLHRSAAVSMASAADEQLRTVAYDQLGLPAGATSPACDSGATVVTSAPSGVTPSDPAVTQAGVSYLLSRCVVWVDATNGDASAYKRTTVLVAWSDETGPHTVRQSSDAYPGSLGPRSSTTSTTAGCGATPTAASGLSASGSLSGTARLDWTTPSTSPEPISSWIVEYSTDGFATASVWSSVAAAAPGQQNEVTVGALSPDTGYSFRVIGVAPSPCTGPTAESPPSPTAALTTGGSASGGCGAGLVTATPSVVARSAGSAQLPDGAITLSVATSGSCSGLLVQYAPTSSSTTTLALSGTGNAWQMTLPVSGASEVWDLGAHTIAILSGATTLAQTTVCVVNQGQSSC